MSNLERLFHHNTQFVSFERLFFSGPQLMGSHHAVTVVSIHSLALYLSLFVSLSPHACMSREMMGESYACLHKSMAIHACPCIWVICRVKICNKSVLMEPIAMLV